MRADSELKVPRLKIVSWDGKHTGLDYEAVPRLQERCRQVEAEVVSNSRNKGTAL